MNPEMGRTVGEKTNKSTETKNNSCAIGYSARILNHMKFRTKLLAVLPSLILGLAFIGVGVTYLIMAVTTDEDMGIFKNLLSLLIVVVLHYTGIQYLTEVRSVLCRQILRRKRS